MPDIISQLKALKLHGMAECYAEIQAQNPELMTSVAVILRQLLEAEVMDRSIRTLRYQMGSARFPIHRDFSGFDFGQSIVDQSLINKLATMKFTDAAQNLVLVGGTGTGKTHLATALGVYGIQNHSKRVRFYSTVELVNTLEQEKAAGKQGRLALSLMQVDLVIGRVGIFTLFTGRRCIAVPFTIKALRANQRYYHNQLNVLGME